MTNTAKVDKNSMQYVFSELEKTTQTKGFIYAICLILIEDHHFNIEEIHQANYWDRLSKNEVSLLLGLLIQQPISIDHPDSPFELIELKNKTISLMKDLHNSLNDSMYENLAKLGNNSTSGTIPSKLEFFGGENSFIEPIFYSGDGIYDFQYLEYLKKKYKYDEQWLSENKKFEFDLAISIALRAQELHHEKIKTINFFDLKANRPILEKKLKKDKTISKKKGNNGSEDFFTFIELFQFHQLFNTEQHIKNEITKERIFEMGWHSFYEGLLNLFCISPDEFDKDLNISAFLNNFSIPANSSGVNHQFKNIGDFNLFTAKPIIQLSNKKYFCPINFSLFESIYESPYYWMLEDKSYHDKLAYNRGFAGEEITYELLKKVFGVNKVFKSVKIESQKGNIVTDIDVLCVLGSKALCVQVKSKKLTQLSRKGSFEQLKKDFQGAFQDAFNQGRICREKILDKTATFYNEVGDKIDLSEGIDEVYILGITTENYPALNYQTSILLEKNKDSPNALFFSIFDLELVLFYLNNPFDFLYYVRQRIELMEYFAPTEEINLLGYHLIEKIAKISGKDFAIIDSQFGQLIDRNYLPFKLGLETSSDNDKIKNRWKNQQFDELCLQIAELNKPKTTDIIFHLLDWDKNSRDNLVNLIITKKIETKENGSWHNFSLMAGPERSTFGLTYVTWENDNLEELKLRLLNLSKLKKYKSKADHWIGLGSLKNSKKFVEVLVLNEKKWAYDESLEKETKALFGKSKKGTTIKFGKKTGRNEPCPCGSNKKFKLCCGRLN